MLKAKTITAFIAKSCHLRPLLRTIDAGVTGRRLPHAMAASECFGSDGPSVEKDPLRILDSVKPLEVVK